MASRTGQERGAAWKKGISQSEQFNTQSAWNLILQRYPATLACSSFCKASHEAVNQQVASNTASLVTILDIFVPRHLGKRDRIWWMTLPCPPKKMEGLSQGPNLLPCWAIQTAWPIFPRVVCCWRAWWLDEIPRPGGKSTQRCSTCVFSWRPSYPISFHRWLLPSNVVVFETTALLRSWRPTHLGW